MEQDKIIHLFPLTKGFFSFLVEDMYLPIRSISDCSSAALLLVSMSYLYERSNSKIAIREPWTPKKGNEMAAETGWTNTAAFEEEIDINASEERVFKLIADPKKVSQIIPEVSNEHTTGNGVYKATYSVKAARIVPLNFDLTYHVIADQTPKQATIHFDGNVEGTLRWNLERRGNGVHVVATANYKFARKIFDDVIKGNIPGGNTGPFGSIASGLSNLAGAVTSGLDLAMESILTKSRDDVKEALKRLKALSE